MRKLYLFLGCILLLFGQTFAQNRSITGTVTDAGGAPVAGASVTIKGSKRGTISETDGTFRISVPAGAKTLVISGVNLSPQEVDIEGRTNVGTIKLQNVNKSLDEVVVVAYGSSKKTNITGSVVTLNGSAVADKPFTSVDKALQGQVAGLQSVSFSGAPGSATDIRIRGIGSISASADPLWVIDGVYATTGDLTINTTTANVLTSLNPDDIESITVLKDAAATSVYGSRAANGVILVTTKKGKAGTTHLNATAEVGNSNMAYMPKNKPLNSKQYQSVLRQSLFNVGVPDTATADAIINDPVNGFGIFPGYENVNTDWVKEVTRTGSQQQYNVNLSGGSDKTTFYASAGYFKQEGITIASDFTRWNGALSLNHKANDWINFSSTLTGASSVQNTPSNGGTFANPVLASYFILPFYTPRNPDGSLRYGDNDALHEFPQNSGPYNPVANAELNSSQNRQTTVRGNVQGEFKILNRLKFTSRFAGEYINSSEDSYLSPFYGDGFSLNGSATSVYRRVFDWTWSNFADYHQELNADKDMFLDLKVGYEASQGDLYTLTATGNNFPATAALKWLASTSIPIAASAAPSRAPPIRFFPSQISITRTAM
jgi:TonB-linked SusC/RagA family outer membrane protein